MSKPPTVLQVLDGRSEQIARTSDEHLFETWVRHQGLPINESTRAAFAVLLLIQQEHGWLN